MASDDPNYNALHGTNVGCFGLFESIDDPEVAAALFDAAAAWLRARGRNEIMGPIDYSTNYVCGLLIDGFKFPPMLLTSHNPPYYPALIERWGFEKTMDLYAWWFANPTEAAARLRRLADALKKAPRGGDHSSGQSARHRRGRPEDPRYLQSSLAPQLGLRAVHGEGIRLHDQGAEAAGRSGARSIAEIGGQPVGFILAIPDINVALRHVNGRLTTFGLPIGLAKLLYYKGKTKTARLIALGVVPKFRRHGIAGNACPASYRGGNAQARIHPELSLTLENNHMINRFLEAIGAEKYKTYRIYRRRLDGKGPE